MGGGKTGRGEPVSKNDLTRNQQIIFSALVRAKSPLSAYKILELESVKKQGLKAPLTIYRALDGLLEKGIVHRIESLNAFVACAHKPHTQMAGFMICEQCGLTLELPTNACARALEKQAENTGFRLQKVSIEMLGLCHKCHNTL